MRTVGTLKAAVTGSGATGSLCTPEGLLRYSMPASPAICTTATEKKVGVAAPHPCL